MSKQDAAKQNSADDQDTRLIEMSTSLKDRMKPWMNRQEEPHGQLPQTTGMKPTGQADENELKNPDLREAATRLVSSLRALSVDALVIRSIPAYDPEAEPFAGPVEEVEGLQAFYLPHRQLPSPVEFPTKSGQRLAVGLVVRPLVLVRGNVPQR